MQKFNRSVFLTPFFYENSCVLKLILRRLGWYQKRLPNPKPQFLKANCSCQTIRENEEILTSYPKKSVRRTRWVGILVCRFDFYHIRLHSMICCPKERWKRKLFQIKRTLYLCSFYFSLFLFLFYFSLFSFLPSLPAISIATPQMQNNDGKKKRRNEEKKKTTKKKEKKMMEKLVLVVGFCYLLMLLLK